MIVFIACSKTKAKKKCRAEELYQGELFQKQLAYAKKINPKEILILSAKYGVLHLDDIISPYNKTLNTMCEKDKKAWAYKCYKQLVDNGYNLNDEYMFLCGENYRKYLMQKLPNSTCPTKGLQLGEQLQFFKKRS